MDLARPEFKLQERRRQIGWLAGGSMLLIGVTIGVSRLKPAAPHVERSTVWTDSAKSGSMLRQARGPGGRYRLNCQPVGNLKFTQRSRIRNQEIGLILQSSNLIGDLTVYKNVELPLTYRQKMSSTDRESRVMESLERVGMAHRVRHYPSQLSGGQQRRSGDGITADLHGEGATVCMVTHDSRFAKHAQGEVHLFDGKVVGEHELKKLMANVPAEPDAMAAVLAET
jgi:ABC-type polar amino acid transport system ATPase subunit